MAKILLKSLLLSPAIVGAALAVSTSAFATETKVNAEATQSQAIAPQSQVLAVKPEVIKADVAPVFSSSTALPAITAQSPVAPAPKLAQAAPTEAVSVEQLNRYSREGRGSQKRDEMAQVTSVSQLSDVRPTDWAFQALQSLVERYGCIVGYPDKTYRGSQALSRYEFAAGLNSCLDRVNELIAAGTADLVKKEDLAVLQRLQEEFAAELATLRGRVDALDARTATLEKQQFSTTTKLSGEVIFAITDEFLQPTENSTVFQNRVRLALNTSFTGKDLLVTRIAAGNAGPGTSGFAFPGAPGYGSEGIQTFNFGFTGGNQAYIDWVAYFFPVGKKINVYVPVVSGLHYDYVPTNAGFLEAYDGGTGALSIFAQRNPIYLIGGGSGVGVNFDLTSAFKVSVGYLADNSDGSQTTFGANNPSAKNGLFGGSYSALAQLTFKPSDAISVGLTYVRAYRRAAIFDGGSGLASSGTILANTGDIAGGGFAPDTFGTTVNAYGLSGVVKLGKNISLNAFGSYITADDLGDGLPEGEIWTYGIGLGIADFGKKGNLLGLMAGVEPYLGNPRQFGATINRRDVPVHLEAFYKYQLNDNISITPGAIYIINPGQDKGNENVLIGTLRTTFTF